MREAFEGKVQPAAGAPKRRVRLRASAQLWLANVVLAAAIVPLVGTTLYRALRAQFARHARLARWTLPIWLYVSVTGVVVYWMLYHG